MISLTEAQIMAWLVPVLWPFIRVLALFSSMPVLGQRNVPIRVRIALSFFIAHRRGRHRARRPPPPTCRSTRPPRSCWSCSRC